MIQEAYTWPSSLTDQGQELHNLLHAQNEMLEYKKKKNNNNNNKNGNRSTKNCFS